MPSAPTTSYVRRSAALLAVAAAALIAPAAASAGVTCSLTAGTLDIDVTTGTSFVWIERGTGASSDDIVVKDFTNAQTLSCGGPTVANTDTIDVDEVAAGQGTVAHISLANGPLGPGATNEADDSDEIEFSYTADNAGTDRFSVAGSATDDNVRFGALAGGDNGVNINSGEATPDTDGTLTGVDRHTVNAGGGADTVSGLGGASVPGATGPSATEMWLQGQEGDDTLTSGNDNSNRLDGGEGNDTLTGGINSDTLQGGPGDDSMDGAGNTDYLSYLHETQGVTVDLRLTGPQATGGAGTDTLANLENAVGSNSHDTLIGTAGANNLNGGQSVADTGNDTLIGLGGNDTLSGAPGNDVLVGGADNDSMVGAAGTDTISYATDSTGPVTVSLANGLTGAQQNTGGAGADTLADDTSVSGIDHSIENVVGSDFADNLTGSAAVNKLSGGAGSDTLALGDNADSFDVHDGGQDSVDCGDGADAGTADEQGVDSLTACETPDFAPQTSIAGGPADGATTSDTTPTYALASDEPASYAVKVDGGSFAACSADCEVPALSDGAHTVTFQARDSDEAGNADLTPVSRTVVVDTTPPAGPTDGPPQGGTPQGGTPQGGTPPAEATAPAIAGRTQAKVSRRRRATIGTVTCGSESCAVKVLSSRLKLRSATSKVPTNVSVSLAPSASGKLVAVLPRRAYRKLGRLGKGTLTVNVAVTAGGKTVNQTLEVTLKR